MTCAAWLPLMLAGLASCAIAASLLFTLLRTGLAWRLATDIPNARSLHCRPTPRIGGWGIVPAVVGWTLAGAPALWLAALTTMALFVLSQFDDRRSLPVLIRLSAHLAAAAALLAVYPAPVSLVAVILLGLLLVWSVNLYNFMDGADGLAGGMALFGFGAYAFAAMPADPSLATGSAAVCGAALGFLFFNFPPARVFLGDAGSIPLGYLAGAFGYWGWLRGVWPAWFPLVVFAPFSGDASVTLGRRLLRGEKFWQAHRDHYYQRMIRMSEGHVGTVRIWYVWMFGSGSLALVALRLPLRLQWMTIAGWMLLLFAMSWRIDWRWRQFQAKLSKVGH